MLNNVENVVVFYESVSSRDIITRRGEIRHAIKNGLICYI